LLTSVHDVIQDLIAIIKKGKTGRASSEQGKGRPRTFNKERKEARKKQKNNELVLDS
jgi:hypothetical protein